MDFEAVLAVARDVLPGYFGPGARALAALRPTDELYDRVFTAAAAGPAREAYAALWTAAPNLPQPPAGSGPLVNAALADDFAAAGPRSKPFPNGYRTVADKLQPGITWLVMRFVQPGSTIGLAFDGFVHVGERQFVWFPKPWKILAAQSPSEWTHWSD